MKEKYSPSQEEIDKAKEMIPPDQINSSTERKISLNLAESSLREAVIPAVNTLSMGLSALEFLKNGTKGQVEILKYVIKEKPELVKELKHVKKIIEEMIKLVD